MKKKILKEFKIVYNFINCDVNKKIIIINQILYNYGYFKIKTKTKKNQHNQFQGLILNK